MADITSLIDMLDDYRTRSVAMRRLRRLGGAAVPDLVRALHDPAEGVRWSAITLLADMADPRALDVLKGITSHPALGRLAEEAIRNIENRRAADLSQEAQPEVKPGTSPGLTDDNLVKQSVAGTSWELERASDGWVVTVSVGHERKQKVHCIFSSWGKGSPIVTVYTRCGPAQDSHYEWALKTNLRLPFGAIGVHESGGQKSFVMINAFLRSTVTPVDLNHSINRLAKEADALEQQLTGGDDTY